jgi:Ca2+-binding EF-hand superfamily protein
MKRAAAQVAAGLPRAEQSFTSANMMNSLCKKFKRGSVVGTVTIVGVRMKIAKVLKDREGIQGMQKLFEEMDADGNGTLTFEELENGFTSTGVDLSTEEVSLLFRYLDVDHSGDIDMVSSYT